MTSDQAGIDKTNEVGYKLFGKEGLKVIFLIQVQRTLGGILLKSFEMSEKIAVETVKDKKY